MVDSITVTTGDGTQLTIGTGTETDSVKFKKIITATETNGIGIKSISYTEGGEDFSIDSQGDDLNETIQSIFGGINTDDVTDEQIKNVLNLTKGTLSTLNAFATALSAAIEQTTTTNTTSSIYNHSSLTDYDIRELMKLLIKAFSELINAQRQVALNTITGIIQALNEKVSAMEKSRDENYKSAMFSAIGQIVMGSLQVIGGLASGASSLKSAKFKFGKGSKVDSGNLEVTGDSVTLKTNTAAKSAWTQGKLTTTTKPAGKAPIIGNRNGTAVNPNGNTAAQPATGIATNQTGNTAAQPANQTQAANTQAGNTAASTATDAATQAETTMQSSISKTSVLAQNSRDFFGGLGSISNASLSLLAAQHTADAKDGEISAARADAFLEACRKMSDEGANQLKTLIDFIGSLLSVMKELQQSASNAELSAAARA